MSLNDDLIALEGARRNVGGSVCRVASILKELSAEDAAALQRLIDETDVYGTQIAGTLASHGFQIRGANIQHHRRRVKGGGCNCPQPENPA